MASLMVVRGSSEGDYYPLGRKTWVLGRDEGASIQVVDDRVSRKHCQVRFDAASGRHFLLDMKSVNGTLINGRQISGDVALADGDEISIGTSKLVYGLTDFPDRESALHHYKQRGQRGRATVEE